MMKTTDFESWFTSKDITKLAVSWGSVGLIGSFLILLLITGWRPAEQDVYFIGLLVVAVVGSRGLLRVARYYVERRNAEEIRELQEQLALALRDAIISSEEKRTAKQEAETAKRSATTIIVAIQTFAGEAGIGGAGYVEILQNSVQTIRDLRLEAQDVAGLRNEVARLRNIPAPTPVVIERSLEEMGYEIVDPDGWLEDRRKGNPESGAPVQFMPQTWRKNVAGGCRADGILWLRKREENGVTSS